MKNCHFVSAVSLEHLWLTVSGFKEQPEVGKAEREATCENTKDNNCFVQSWNHTHGFFSKVAILKAKLNCNKK